MMSEMNKTQRQHIYQLLNDHFTIYINGSSEASMQLRKNLNTRKRKKSAIIRLFSAFASSDIRSAGAYTKLTLSLLHLL